jgi:hypothetical protein
MRPWESVSRGAGISPRSGGGEPAEPGGGLGSGAEGQRKLATAGFVRANATREAKESCGSSVRSDSSAAPGLGFVSVSATARVRSAPRPPPARPRRGPMCDWEFYPISAAVATAI